MKIQVGRSKPYSHRGWDFSVRLYEHEKGEFSAEVSLVTESEPSPGKFKHIRTDITFDSQEKAENDVVHLVQSHINQFLGNRPKAK